MAKTNLIQSKKRQEVVESRDHPPPERACHTKDKKIIDRIWLLHVFIRMAVDFLYKCIKNQ